MFILMRKGRVQWTEKNGLRGMVIAPTRKLAEEFAKLRRSRKMSVAEIGSLEGETLAGQLAASLEKGANAAFIVDSVKNGEAILSVMTYSPA